MPKCDAAITQKHYDATVNVPKFSGSHVRIPRGGTDGELIFNENADPFEKSRSELILIVG